MPKTPIDFSKAVIYSIVCKTDETLIYVGSTTNFRERKYSHKSACINENDGNHNLQVYVMIRANGGWDSFEMTPIKEFPCKNKVQLVIEEERIRKEMNAKLNTRKAFLSLEERMEYNKVHREYYAEHYAEYHKEWNKNNAEYVAERQKQYYQANAVNILEQTKKYQKENIAKITEYGKKYYQANAVKLCDYQKNYREVNAEQRALFYQANKDEYNRRRREKRRIARESIANI
jgi:hypothetical protein